MLHCPLFLMFSHLISSHLQLPHPFYLLFLTHVTYWLCCLVCEIWDIYLHSYLRERFYQNDGKYTRHHSYCQIRISWNIALYLTCIFILLIACRCCVIALIVTLCNPVIFFKTSKNYQTHCCYKTRQSPSMQYLTVSKLMLNWYFQGVKRENTDDKSLKLSDRISPWTQNVNWTYIKRSKDVQNVFWTPYVRWIYVLCLQDWKIPINW